MAFFTFIISISIVFSSSFTTNFFPVSILVLPTHTTILSFMHCIQTITSINFRVIFFKVSIRR